mgnify:CR=1 FL=1
MKNCKRPATLLCKTNENSFNRSMNVWCSSMENTSSCFDVQRFLTNFRAFSLWLHAIFFNIELCWRHAAPLRVVMLNTDVGCSMNSLAILVILIVNGFLLGNCWRKRRELCWPCICSRPRRCFFAPFWEGMQWSRCAMTFHTGRFTLDRRHSVNGISRQQGGAMEPWNLAKLLVSLERWQLRTDAASKLQRVATFLLRLQRLRNHT